MSSDLAISVKGLSKAYTIRHQAEQHITLAEAALARARHPFRRSNREQFWALRDISFDVHEGEVLGLIGRNGAGKSTLLKVLSRITAPSTGRVDLYGRVGSLLEVGTGFHPELTGRENIFLNGTILGMRHKQIERRFDEIVDFAGVAQFLDTPVKRYSTGMSVRLAFSVAAHLETEILLVDEVLAVGDVEFQRKCLAAMRDVAAGGRTVLFVSHNLEAVRQLCTRAVLLAGGQIATGSSVDDVVAEYLADFSRQGDRIADQDPDRRAGSGELRFVDVEMADPTPLPAEPKIVRFAIERRRPYDGRYWVSAELFDDRGTTLIQCDSRVNGQWMNASDTYHGELEIRQPWLRPGRYRLNLYICAAGVLDRLDAAAWFEVPPILPYAFSASEDATATGVVFADFAYRNMSLSQADRSTPDQLSEAHLRPPI